LNLIALVAQSGFALDDYLPQYFDDFRELPLYLQGIVNRIDTTSSIFYVDIIHKSSSKTAERSKYNLA